MHHATRFCSRILVALVAALTMATTAWAGGRLLLSISKPMPTARVASAV